MLTTLNKILLTTIVAMLVVFAGYVLYKEHQIATMQTQIQNTVIAMQQLKDGIASSQNQYATKADIDAIAKQNDVNLGVIQQNLNAFQATITAINVVNANTPGENVSNQPSTSTTPVSSITVPTVNCNGQQVPCPNSDPFGYVANAQHYSLNEPTSNGTSIPFGSITFTAASKEPWAASITPRQYNVVNVMGTDQNNRHYVYNKFTVNEDNKSYPLTISTAQYAEEYPQASLSWFNPRLFGGVDAGINISGVNGMVSPNLDIGVISYGKTKPNPEFWFAQVGVGYDTIGHNANVSVSPVQYNFGQTLPTSLIQNSYVGPYASIGFNGNVGAGASIRIGF